MPTQTQDSFDAMVTHRRPAPILAQKMIQDNRKAIHLIPVIFEMLLTVELSVSQRISKRSSEERKLRELICLATIFTNSRLTGCFCCRSGFG